MTSSLTNKFLLTACLLATNFAHSAPDKNYVSIKDFYDDLSVLQEKRFNSKTQLEILNSLKDNSLSKLFQWTPSLSLSGGRNRITTEKPSSVTDSDFVAVDAQMNLFKSGGDYFRTKSANQTVEAQKNNLESLTLSNESQNADIIFNLIATQELLALQKTLVDLKEESFKIARERFKAGQIPAQDITKSEVDLNQQKMSLKEAEIRVLESNYALKSLGLADLKTKKWPLTGLASESSKNFIGKDFVETYRLLSLKQNASAKENLWQAARTGHGPSLDLTYQWMKSPYQRDPMTETTTTGVVLTLPLWSKWETQSVVSSAYADYVGSQNSYVEALQEEQAKNELIRKKLELVQQNLNTSSENLQRSESLYKDMIKAYRFGRLSTNDLFAEQNRLIDSHLRYTSAQLDFHKGLMDICHQQNSKITDCPATKNLAPTGK